MTVGQRVRLWWQIYTGQDATPLDTDAPAWLVSLLVHVAGLAVLAGATFLLPSQTQDELVLSPPLDDPLPETYRSTDSPDPQIGAPGNSSSSLVIQAAPVRDDVQLITTEVKDPADFGKELVVIDPHPQLLGPHVELDRVVRGISTVGETGAAGAVDRITHEILRSLEQRPTLVVWIFDRSGSLRPQREAIEARFDRIYQELGVFEAANNPAFAQHRDKPLLTSVAAFGAGVQFLIETPTDDVAQIKQSVRSIQDDPSGVENVFGAVYASAERFVRYRTRARPRRNVMLVLITDEAGDDIDNLEPTVNLCRRQQMPVYVVGTPAPFGRENVYFKYVDPDPNFDQSPHWVPVKQGPESLMPERVKLRFAGMSVLDEPVDSGFGPFGLTRLCHETGGLYFSVHPNRNQRGNVTRRSTPRMATYLAEFYDPKVMRRYRPDYISVDDYRKSLNANRARMALVQAAQMSWTTPMENPRFNFPKQSDAQLASDLTLAQRESARIEPKVRQLYEILRAGEKDRAELTTPRWQAGYDLAMGRTLSVLVRTEGYNRMLAKAKQGMKFASDRNDTWVMASADDIETGSAMGRLADQAKMYLQRVAEEHPNTPWARLAAREMSVPLGWKWNERYTGVNAPPQRNAGNGQPARPRNDRMRNAPPRKPRRAPPAL